ncbi:hypothetical protein LCGC14_0224070 [marine sediment metagenome]|uniref:Uncharacterized protein n=1 Tax=marine sediment metagenome TaxID=412755 RepID=A0A0F9UGP7_9ZZZZ
MDLTKKQKIALGVGIPVGLLSILAISKMSGTFTRRGIGQPAPRKKILPSILTRRRRGYNSGEWVTTPQYPIRNIVDLPRQIRGRGSIIEGGRASQFSITPPDIRAATTKDELEAYLERKEARRMLKIYDRNRALIQAAG